MTIEDDDDAPDDKAQPKVNTNLDCWGRVSGGRTTLITILFLEIEFSEPDNHIRFFEISDNERSASEIPASSTLHEATPDTDPDCIPAPGTISPDSFSFWEGLMRAPLKLTIEITGESEGNTRTLTDTLEIRLSADFTLIVTSCDQTVFEVRL
jgi:hypothetical protein